ncbi:MAG: MFS transporter [Pseudomonadota bacterium]
MSSTPHRDALLAGWPAALLLIGAGIVSAFQVGKAPAALEEVRRSLELSLEAASWLLSAIGLVGALIGTAAGSAADRLGARRVAIAGLLLQGAAAFAATLVPNVALLFAMRVLEGLGFQATTVAAPALIAATMPERSRAAALAAWSTFMPLGICLALVAAPAVLPHGWQALWQLSGVLAFAFAMLVLACVPRGAQATLQRPLAADLRDTVRSPGPRLLALLFLLFTTAYFALVGFLPALLAQAGFRDAAETSRLAGWAVAAGAGGNLAGAWLLARGVRPMRLVGLTFALLAASGAGVLLLDAGPQLRYALCLAFGGVAGLLPAALFAQVPEHAPRPELAGTTTGLMMQGNNIGLVLGPALAGVALARGGWAAVALLVALPCAAGIAMLAGSARSGHTRIPRSPRFDRRDSHAKQAGHRS